MPTPTSFIRVYNIRFGDCFLVSLHTSGGQKQILIDFGNASGSAKGGGGTNDVFTPIAADIAKETGGHLDLLIMTHEHLDHMEGFYSEKTIFDKMKVDDVWMSIMSQPDYHKTHKDCEPIKKARLALANLSNRWKSMKLYDDLPDGIAALIDNNILNLANIERIQYLRNLGKKVHYLYRGMGDVNKFHTLGNNIKIKVLAPEEDASVYYSKKDPEFMAGMADRLGGENPPVNPKKKYQGPEPPSHMAKEEFEHLREDIAELDMTDLLAIDKAANNTSLVVQIEFGGKILLFAGDAEAESWAIMKKKNLLEKVDVLKVAHHGSINGMPFEGTNSVVQDLISKKTTAIVSTRKGVYGSTTESEIPNKRLMALLQEKCKKVLNTEKSIGIGDSKDIPL